MNQTPCPPEPQLTLKAKEAMRWLFGEEASTMTCERARYYIGIKWGEEVRAELEALTAEPRQVRLAEPETHQDG